MIDHVIDACHAAGVKRVVAILSPAQPEVAEHLGGRCEVAYQPEQKGSGDAFARAPEDVLARGDVMVVNGDAPLLRGETLRRVADAHRKLGAPATLASVEDPSRSDGRIVRGRDGSLERIVEARDATQSEKSITEINVGLYCFRGGSELLQALAMLQPANAAGELYLTDLFQQLRPVQVVRLKDPVEGLGVNDRVQLAIAEKALRSRILEQLMLSGVTVTDPDTTFVEAGVKIGQDTVIEPFTIIRGETRIGRDCRIGPAVDMSDCRIADGCRIEHSWLKQCSMGEGSDCGPYSKLRPGTELGLRVHVGSFAEIVRSKIGAGSAVPHFSYVGDAVIGENVNFAAGAVTANYDGTSKHRTVIEDDVLVGVDTVFRAPVRVGKGSRTGAGAVVTKDVPAGATAVGMPARVVRRNGKMEGP